MSAENYIITRHRSSSMGVVSVRLDEETERKIRARGVKPGTFARLAILKELRRLEIEEGAAFLRKHSVRPIGQTSVEMIREDRDHGHRPGQGF